MHSTNDTVRYEHPICAPDVVQTGHKVVQGHNLGFCLSVL